jgi:formate dehydrogenase iron-sulfur subunit
MTLTTPITIYVPRDSTALALGAEAVARAIRAQAALRGIDVDIVRNGSRGMFWLEPMVEVATPDGRIAFGPVAEDDVTGLFDAGAFNADFLQGGRHPLALGWTEQIPYLKQQERLTFARVGITDPVSLDDYLAHDGYVGLQAALDMPAADIVQQVLDSGLRGRGGAAFPTGIKWKTVLAAQAAQKYIVCNADEGDSGTFSDRMVMEDDPFMLLEGMTIAGLAVGATLGTIYVRSEYPHAAAALNEAIGRARAAGYLGSDVQGSGKAFDVDVRIGAGSYVCGEETALLESLEGKRGIVRAKPPLPAIEGLFGQPTVINNVISLASVPLIFARGAAFYKDYGIGRSRGTLPLQLGGNIKRGGLVEKAFGVTLRTLLEDFGGGTESGAPIRAVQVGGPLGAYLPASQFDTPLDYESFAAIGAALGHGGIVVCRDDVDMAKQVRYAMEFCAIESCGKCTPCRIGATRGVELVDKIIANEDGSQQLGQQIHLLRDLCDLMLHGSLCAMGGMTPFPVLSALNHFPEDFGADAAAAKQPGTESNAGLATSAA